MNKLQIILGKSKAQEAALNWGIYEQIMRGHISQDTILYGITPFSMLVLTLQVHPEWRRHTKDIVWMWYGYALGYYAEPKYKYVEDLFKTFSQDSPERAVKIWETLLEPDTVKEEAPIPHDILWEGMGHEVPHQIAWCLRLMGQDLFLWRRSDLVTNPLLISVLREICDLYGILSLWSERKDDSQVYEGQFIQIPMRYLKERRNV